MDIEEKYKKCPVCEDTPMIKEVNEVLFIECICGLCLVLDKEGNELL